MREISAVKWHLPGLIQLARQKKLSEADIQRALQEACRKLFSVFALSSDPKLAKYRTVLENLWNSSVDNYYSRYSPRAYKRTNSLKAAFDAKEFLSHWSVTYSGSITAPVFLWECHYTFDKERQVEEAHKRGQATGTRMSKDVARAIWAGDNPKDLGIVGSLGSKERPWFEAFVAAGSNAPRQPIVYDALGQPKGKSTVRRGDNASLITSFLKAMGCVYDAGAPTRAGWNIKITDLQASSILWDYIDMVFDRLFNEAYDILSGHDRDILAKGTGVSQTSRSVSGVGADSSHEPRKRDENLRDSSAETRYEQYLAKIEEAKKRGADDLEIADMFLELERLTSRLDGFVQ